MLIGSGLDGSGPVLYYAQMSPSIPQNVDICAACLFGDHSMHDNIGPNQSGYRLGCQNAAQGGRACECDVEEPAARPVQDRPSEAPKVYHGAASWGKTANLNDEILQRLTSLPPMPTTLVITLGQAIAMFGKDLVEQWLGASGEVKEIIINMSERSKDAG